MNVLPVRCAALALLLVACHCVRPPEPIPKPYPRLESPEAALEFFKRAARLDDPSAGWHALSKGTRGQIGFSDFVTGWAWYRDYFELFGDAEITARKPVPEGVVLRVRLLSIEEPFLAVPEEGEWRLELPSRYSQRSLEDLFRRLKELAAARVPPRERPARRGGG